MTWFDRSLLYFSVATLILIGLGLLWPFGTAAMSAEVAAAPSTVVVIPWGDAVAAVLQMVAAAVVAVVPWMLRQLPGEIGALMRTRRVEQLLQRAIAYGCNAVAGAAQGQTLRLDVGSQVLVWATRYARDRAPAHLLTWMGGRDAVAEMIWSRLPIEARAGMTAAEAMERYYELRDGDEGDDLDDEKAGTIRDAMLGNSAPAPTASSAASPASSDPSGASPSDDGPHPV